MTRFRLALAALCLAACAAHAQAPSECPEAAPADVKCYSGQDANGAWYLIAMPERWNHVLVVHAQGGPETRTPSPERVRGDFSRWVVTVRSGYAWAGTSYRRAGYGVRMAAEDVENLRKLFVARFGAPRRTLMHGQSWGGNVGARAVEIYPSSYDGALLTSGVLAGGTRGYDYRIDLRVVYQYYCHNHPRPDEPQYPLWMGLPPGAKMTSADVRQRVNECTGYNRPADQRTPAQKRALADILAATRVPERTLISHLTWATLLFSDIVHARLGGRNPFSTEGVEYRGTSDDRALNAGVARFRPDPAALAELAEDSDPTGKVTVPVLTLHAIDDPTAFVEHESVYRAVREKAGTADRLVQVFADEHEHSYLSSPEYVAAFAALLAWIDAGDKPTPQSVLDGCRKRIDPGEGQGCHIVPSYRPAPYESRVYPRIR